MHFCTLGDVGSPVDTDMRQEAGNIYQSRCINGKWNVTPSFKGAKDPTAYLCHLEKQWLRLSPNHYIIFIIP